MICISVFLFSQVGIGTASPAPSSMLELSATDKGFLPPRLTTMQRDGITNPPAGLWIYNTDENCMQYWNETAWKENCSTMVKTANLNKVGKQIESEKLTVRKSSEHMK